MVVLALSKSALHSSPAGCHTPVISFNFLSGRCDNVFQGFTRSAGRKTPHHKVFASFPKHKVCIATVPDDRCDSYAPPYFLSCLTSHKSSTAYASSSEEGIPNLAFVL